jgi:hypothetical protein
MQKIETTSSSATGHPYHKIKRITKTHRKGSVGVSKCIQSASINSALPFSGLKSATETVHITFKGLGDEKKRHDYEEKKSSFSTMKRKITQYYEKMILLNPSGTGCCLS